MGEPTELDANVHRLKKIFEQTPYYEAAEATIDSQWRAFIFPRLLDLDFSRTLELAPGHGRNSVRLKDLAQELHLVDINESCIEACRQRLADHDGPCRIHYHVNDGKSLPVSSGSITLFYSWDSMVHFDAQPLLTYLEEIRRVLIPGGHAFIHHSNYGDRSHGPTFESNPSLRGNVTAEQFASWCAKLGLKVLSQESLDWDGIEALDSVALLRR